MKKRINFTGRRKLASEHIEIRVQKPEGQKYPMFTASIAPASMDGLDKNARVYIEPYVVSSSMRFDFDTVSQPKIPAETLLSELDREESFLFRVKVVDESGQVGKILADASGIQPKDADDDGINRKSLFPVQWLDLGERIWRVDLNPHTGPVLQVTTKVPELPTKLKNDPLLQGVIYPQAFREVLWFIIREEEIDDDLPWVQNWREFIRKLTSVNLDEETPEDDEDREDFVEDAVKAFSGQHNFASRAKQFEEVVS
jgi:hypothetical protein